MPDPRVPGDDISRWHAAIAPELRAAFEEVLAGPRFTMGQISRHLKRNSPLTAAGAYASLPWRSEPIPVAESLPDRLLSLPMFAELTDEEIDRVGAAITEFYGTA